MAGPAFDPSGAVRFDLKSGVASDARGGRLVLVPSAALDALDDATLERVGGEIGRAAGARVAARLGGDADVRSAQLEVVVSHLAGELAMAGVGAMHLERWGRAMIAVVANASVARDAFLAGVIGGAMASASGRELFAAAVGRDGGAARFFLGSRETTLRVRDLVAGGKTYAEVVADLQGGAS